MKRDDRAQLLPGLGNLVLAAVQRSGSAAAASSSPRLPCPPNSRPRKSGVERVGTAEACRSLTKHALDERDSSALITTIAGRGGDE